MNQSKAVFLHLSDIHFKHESEGQIIDFDLDLRNELEIDASILANKYLKVNGILITGDIAFSGKDKEFEDAQNWLNVLSDRVKCKKSDIWITPGNHDVNRDNIKKKPMIIGFHKQLRSSKLEDIDSNIKSFLMDQESMDMLLRGIREYNQFASKFECAFTTNTPWQHDHILNDGSTLRICGLNSVFISDEDDNDSNQKLVLGGNQTSTFLRQDGVEYMTLCHHPPQWLRDEDAVNSMLNARVKIQLFGHKHKQKIEQIDGIVRISAGAIHPDRREPHWTPRYNWLEIFVENKNNERFLNLKVFQRIWDDEAKQFKPDVTTKGEEFREYSLPLAKWFPSNVKVECESGYEADKKQGEKDTQDPKIIENEINNCHMNPDRELIYKFFSLSYDVRLRIAQQLDLIVQEDEGQIGTELFKKFIQRAKEKNKYSDFKNLVEKYFISKG